MLVRYLEAGGEGELENTGLFHHERLEQTRVQADKCLAPYDAVVEEAVVDASGFVDGRVDEGGKCQQFVRPNLSCVCMACEMREYGV